MGLRVITLGACALAAACADTKPLRIAVVGSSAASLGAVLAVEDINAEGGINGRLLELGVANEPEHVTARQAIATADSLARDPDLLAVIGHGGSATSIAASQVYNARHIPQIAPNSSSPLYRDAGDYSFRLVSGDDHQAEFIATQVAEDSTHPRVAVLYMNDDYGRALSDMLHNALQRYGIEPVQEAPFVAGPDFERYEVQLVRALADARPDVVVWIGLAPELKLIRPLLRTKMPRLRVFASDGASFIGEEGDLKIFGGDWFVAYTDITSNDPRLRSLAARFAPMTGRPITDGAVLTYDAVRLVADAMLHGARSRAAIQRYLAEGGETAREYDGISGKIRLDEKGDARPSYVLLQLTSDGARRLK